MVRTVLLDLDGTLTDPFEGISRSIVHALDRLGRPAPEGAALRAWIGPPLRESFRRHLGDDAEAERAVAHYRERYADVGLYENRVYDGIPAALVALAGAGATLVLATSKPRVFAERIVAHFGLAPIAAVYGAELDGRLDDKSALIADIVRQRRLAPGAAVMVGDRSHDVVGARSNGIAVAGVAWGYGSDEERARHPPDRVVAVPGDLPAAAAALAGEGDDR